MKKTKMLVALLLAVMLVLPMCFTACQDPHECKHVCPECGLCLDATCDDPACKDKCKGHEKPGPGPVVDQLVFAKGTELRMATGYNSKATGISFDADTVTKSGKDGVITLANGKSYRAGELKPTWVTLQEKLGMKFIDKYQGKKSSEEWAYWKEQLDQIDMVSGTAALLNEAGVAGNLINIAEYLDKMPNFKAYLEANPIVRLSITGATDGSAKGAIYFSPYFDGVNDIERMPLMRADMIIKLLDGDKAFTGANRAVNTSAYKPYMTASYDIESLTADGTKTQIIKKQFGTGAKANIIEQMNAVPNLTGDKAVEMFRAYIDAMYGKTYAKRSDLFLGYDAAWDADELVALLRCAVASLNDSENKAISGLFSRQTNSVQRQVDLFRFAGSLFGARGMESRQDYLYVGTDGKLHDARQEKESYIAVEKLNQMYTEGLIIMDGEAKSDNYLEKDAGLVSYDYSQTQTIMNGTKLQEGEKYMAAMVPVAMWKDSTGAAKAMRFTESWRSVKTDGWAISKTGVGSDQNKLYAALKLIDYAYSKEGQILMSYGPDDFIKKDAQGNIVTFNFNGQQWPEIADATRTELMEKANGSYTDYARKFLGSTLSFVKSQSFEFQCTHEVGREGAAKLSAAIGLGTIKHPELAVTKDWYMSVPTVLPNTKEESNLINTYTEIAGDSGKFSQSNGKVNKFLEMITGGYAVFGDGITNADQAVELVSKTWKGAQYLKLKQDAMDRLLVFYEGLGK